MHQSLPCVSNWGLRRSFGKQGGTNLCREVEIMENLICGAVFGIIAFVTYTNSVKSKNANEAARARLWMAVSVFAGVIAVLSVAVAIAG